MPLVIANDVGRGLALTKRDSIMALGAGLTCALGDVMMVDESVVDAAGNFTTIIVPTTAQIQYGLFCVCLAAQATAAGDVLVRWEGYVDKCLVDGGTADIDTKDALIPVNAARNLADGTAATNAEKVIGKWPSATAYTSATLALKPVMFSGVNGFGNVI